MLASLLLDLKKINVEFSIFITEFENLIVTYFWILNVRYCVCNVNSYVAMVLYSKGAADIIKYPKWRKINNFL